MDTQNISKHPTSLGNLLTECITWGNIQPYLYFQNPSQRKVWYIFHKANLNKKQKVTWQPAGMLLLFGGMRSRVKSNSSESDPKVTRDDTMANVGERKQTFAARVKKATQGAWCTWGVQRVSVSSHTHIQQSGHRTELWASICKHVVVLISVWKESNTNIHENRGDGTVMLRRVGPSWGQNDDVIGQEVKSQSEVFAP